VRDDGGYDAPGEVPIHYDSLISKLVTWGTGRPEAIARMRRALAEYEIAGVKTTIPFFTWLLDDEDFLASRVDTTFLDRALAERNGTPFGAPGAGIEDLAALGAALDAYFALRQPRRAVGSPWISAARAEARR
jgi:acetyl/propionyl-CoA carboxylase alpha subunit